MKYILITIILSVFSIIGNAKIANDSLNAEVSMPSESCILMTKKEYKQLYKKTYKSTKYWKRYKTLRAIGWPCFGVGFAGTIATGFATIVDASDGKANTDAKGLVDALAITGIELTLAGITTTTLAYINRFKARHTARIMLKSSGIKVVKPNGKKQVEPAIGVCLEF